MGGVRAEAFSAQAFRAADRTNEEIWPGNPEKNTKLRSNK